MAYWHADTPDNVLAKSYQAIFDKLMYLSANSASYRYWSRFYFAIGKWWNLLVRYSVDGCEIFVINHGVSGEGSANPGQVRRLIFEI